MHMYSGLGKSVCFSVEITYCFYERTSATTQISRQWFGNDENALDAI